MRVVLVTGGFDPLHSGHIEYFKAAKALGDHLMVALNSDAWLTRKKGRPFMPLEERMEIVRNLKVVDSVTSFNDEDDTANFAIKGCLNTFPDSEIVFANGGDREASNTPEFNTYGRNARVHFEFGVGGQEKKNSSSWILNDWKAPKTERDWGYYRVLHTDGKETKVKELLVDPGKELSLQRHRFRSEHWIVTEGTATIWHGIDTEYMTKKQLAKHQEIDIPVGYWHQLCNETDQPLKIVEIQHGINCIEDDIQRHIRYK